MSKNKTRFVCQGCGATYPQWTGKCTECGAWNQITEQNISVPTSSNRWISNQPESEPVLLHSVEKEALSRFSSGSTELDRVLGGGLVAGSVVLLGGDPGIGKSTLLLQTLGHLAKERDVLYISGEESLAQIAARADRMKIVSDHLFCVAETQMDRLLQQADKTKPGCIVVDSIQTMCHPDINSMPGSVSQVRECAMHWVRYAKASGSVLFLIGHVTKEGAIAGPRVLEHMVDTVLYFEGSDDLRFRMVRSVKNRFGQVNEVGMFAMMDEGLRDLKHPSAIFLSKGSGVASGGIVTALWEGSRPILVEIQALVDQCFGETPKRLAVGFDGQRLLMLLAVLSRFGKVSLHQKDIFMNAVGGMRVSETSADLAMIMAMMHSLNNTKLSEHWLVLGEVGLGGEVRPVPHGQERLQEALKHGIKQVLLPKGNQPSKVPDGVRLHAANTLQEALSCLKMQSALAE